MNYFDEYRNADKQMETNPSDTVTALSMVMKSKGVNQRDMSTLNAWPTSRTNKIINGRQNATAKDCRIMARSLGCVIRNNPAGNDGKGDIQFLYKVDRFGNLIIYLKNFPRERDEEIITKFEIPISIVNLLGIEATDFIITSEIDHSRVEERFLDDGIYIMFEQRHVFTGPDAICFGMIISPDRNTIILGIWFFTEKWDENSLEMRFNYKHILDVRDCESKEYDKFASRNAEWLPMEYRMGQIDSEIYTMEEISNAEFLEIEMINLFKEYCGLIHDACGFDIAENTAGAFNIGFSAVDIYNGLMGPQPLSFDVKQEILEAAGRKCEINPDHPTFIGADGRPYMEVIPLIPIMAETMSIYGQVLNSEANAICLCPMCAAQLIHGNRDAREDMLGQLHRNHRDMLRKVNTNVSLTQLLSWHRVE